MALVRVSLFICSRTPIPSIFGNFRSSKISRGGASNFAHGIVAAAEQEIESLGAVLQMANMIDQLAFLECVDSQLCIGRIIFDQ